ncbi:MAG: hypothetical protein R3325_09485 [Thermoanaerobaculia bacterium]|nr:hypothetical protein [Thermoanaerobaculia bacterium]
MARPSLPLAGLLAALLASSAASSPPAAAASRDPGPPHATRLEIGSPPPTPLELPALDGRVLSTADAESPLLLIFFRGVW